MEGERRRVGSKVAGSLNRVGNCIRWAGWRESAVGVRSKVGSWLEPRWELQMAGGRSGVGAPWGGQ